MIHSKCVCDHLHCSISLKSYIFLRSTKMNEQKKISQKKTNKHIFIFLVTFVLFHCIFSFNRIISLPYFVNMCFGIVTIMCTAAKIAVIYIFVREYFCYVQNARRNAQAEKKKKRKEYIFGEDKWIVSNSNSIDSNHFCPFYW